MDGLVGTEMKCALVQPRVEVSTPETPVGSILRKPTHAEQLARSQVRQVSIRILENTHILLWDKYPYWFGHPSHSRENANVDREASNFKLLVESVKRWCTGRYA